MDINYFLYCKKKYNNMIYYFDNVIQEYDDIINNSISVSQNINHEDIKLLNFEIQISNMVILKKIYIEEKEKISYLIKDCNEKIMKVCIHDFIDDSIDITPELSQNISYCSLCGYTK